VPARVRIGTLAVEDTLPLWVAANKGLVGKAGLKVDIIPFETTAQRDVAFTDGKIDGFIGDIIATAELASGGFPARIITVALGATPAEGRYGLVASQSSGIRELKEAAGVPVGVSSGTIQDYVLEGLMRQAGVPADRVMKEELKRLPNRYQLLVAGGIKAAALPEPFLSSALKDGARLLADDTKGENLSQTVLVMNDAFLKKPEGAESVRRLLGVWDKGVAIVNASPNSFRDVLVGNAVMNEEQAADYAVSTYPKHVLPTVAQVDAVLDWMRTKNLLNGSEVTYGDIVYDPAEPARSKSATGAVPPIPGAATPATGAPTQ
jgi:NitT/TauT family transport system substrate-binding protein